MTVDLLEHNQKAYENIKEALASGTRKLAISHATGTGKSYLIGKLFEDYNDKKKLVLVPSAYIRDQLQELFDKYNIVNADVMLYQKLIKVEDKDISDMDYGVIALDEFHHDTSKVWGSKVKILIESHADSIIFGTTATPIRSDGINALDELFERNCVSELPLSIAIAKKVVPLPVYVGALYSLDEELERLRAKVDNATNTDDEKKELYDKINSMRKQIEKSYGMPIILNKHIKDSEGKYLVFCKNKKHLVEIKDTVTEWFKIAGFKDIHSYVVHSSYEGKDKEYKAFCDDTSHVLKLLFCVNMLNEGLHLSDISGVLLLRPTNSNIIWLQQIGRCIESNNSKNPVIIDAVNNFNAVQQGNGLLQEIKEAVKKEKESGNRGSGDSDLIDIDTFFVTEYVQNVQEMFGQVEGRLKDGWDLYIRALRQYKEREGDCLVPLRHVEFLEDGTKLNLGFFVSRVRKSKKGESIYVLTPERTKQLNDLNFIWEAKISRFDKFYKYALLYKQKYGHTNLKFDDILNGYSIGGAYNQVMNDYKKGKLTEEQVERLKSIGIDITMGKYEKHFKNNMALAQQALNEGIVLSQKNRKYKNVDLYRWYSFHRDKFTNQEYQIMEKLIPCQKNKKAVKMIDVKNKKYIIYPSKKEAGKALCNDFHLVNTENSGISTVYQYLSGRTKKTIYKGRFRFEYAEDEEPLKEKSPTIKKVSL